MTLDPRAGQLPDEADLIDLDRLLAAYHENEPAAPVAFGTSGHRGTSLDGSFTEAHVVAISAAVCAYRSEQGIAGPLYLGRDTHALSEPAARTIVEVLAGHGVEVVVDAAGGPTPTPVISHAILTHNRGGQRANPPSADGIVVTPSHNPPGDGGFKYNPPHGGPADTDVTGWIERAANRLLEDGLDGVPRVPFEEAHATGRDYVTGYVEDLASVIDLDAIRAADVSIGRRPARRGEHRVLAGDPRPPRARHRDRQRPARPDVPLRAARPRRQDPDGLLVAARDGAAARARRPLRRRVRERPRRRPPRHRHAVRRACSNPNHHLAACIAYLFGGHRDWGAGVGIGKTLVSSSIIDRLAADLGRRLVEVPVGFKWFVPGLLDGTIGFGGEESAGASFLRRDGTAWSTDKDGLIPCLLAAEMKATTGKDPGEIYEELAGRFGRAAYKRTDVAATPAQKDVLKKLSPEQVESDELAGEPIEAVLTEAPGNGASIGGLKVVAEHGWFAARPSGTEDVYKVYAESLDGEERLERIIGEAEQIVGKALEG